MGKFYQDFVTLILQKVDFKQLWERLYKEQALKEQTSKYGQIVVGVVVPLGLRWETVLNIKQLIGSG